ncbi:MAG TPA: hypothetical protein VLA34_02940, partial [Candidatus Krumholzibacterium sp.]|nr:hypothetical protein [Candidatus Krumholzibacterium sp.]
MKNAGCRKTLQFLTILSIFMATVAVPAVIAAGENEDFRFAQRLQRDGMYIAAAEEFLRVAEKYPSSALRPRCLFSAGESWMRAGKANEG